MEEKYMKVYKCNLYSGNLFLVEKHGKYHIMQGGMDASEMKVWHNTPEEAVECWNNRLYGTQLCGESTEIRIVG